MDAVHTTAGSKVSMDGVKRRTRAGHGTLPGLVSVHREAMEIHRKGTVACAMLETFAKIRRQVRELQLVTERRVLFKGGMTHMRACGIVIVAGGPAGLAAAVSARKQGIEDVLILERDQMLGGILNQCIHNGFGLHTFKEELTGPEYADALHQTW